MSNHVKAASEPEPRIPSLIHRLVKRHQAELAAEAERKREAKWDKVSNLDIDPFTDD